MLTQADIDKRVETIIGELRHNEEMQTSILRHHLGVVAELAQKQIAAEKPALKEWPALPARALCCNVDGRQAAYVWGVQEAGGGWLFTNVRKETAEAIAIALNEFWNLVGSVRRNAEYHPTEDEQTHTHTYCEHCRRRDALLARIAAAGFDLDAAGD